MTYPELPESLLDIEEAMLERWRTEDLFRQTLTANEEGEPFVFYEGPPTANGRPGLHHIIGRTIKDLVCRYHAMQGRSVTRIAGWDTHGLPVEIEAEKKLGISGKPEIEALGIAEFNQVCKDSVFTYKEEWKELSERIAYWLEYWRPYVTFEPEYIESVWWILKSLADKDLLYRGHKSVPYCPRCGTTLSSHEVAQGYKNIEDPSLTFVAEVLEDDGAPDGRALLAWTTTPWTVASNTGLAVHPELSYVEVARGNRRYVVAEARVEALFGESADIVGAFKGADLVGLRYRRPLEVVPMPDDPENGWTVIGEDFVSAQDGTGIVHMAPAFGADDYAAGQKHGLPMLNPIDDAGRFHDYVDLVGGRFVKDADTALVDALRDRGLLFDIGRITHSYPHCWRCDSPLLYVARDSWFIRTSSLKDQLLANNEQVAWHPPEIGENRFGEWLRGNVDWALSRDRYWGTPLPVWVCDGDDSHTHWIGSLAELADAAGGLPDDFDPHRPFIDELTWACADCDGTMRRTPEVIDVWFDSGAMPFAQWHYPFENQDEFRRHFPADFISEGLDQTRGWFYSLMAISTLLGRGPCYRNVIVNDMILDAEGQKMSKSKGNLVNPWDAIAEHGADVLALVLHHLIQPVGSEAIRLRGCEGGREEVLRHALQHVPLLQTVRGRGGVVAVAHRPRGGRPPAAGSVAALAARLGGPGRQARAGRLSDHEGVSLAGGLRRRRSLELVRAPEPIALLGEQRPGRPARGLSHAVGCVAPGLAARGARRAVRGRLATSRIDRKQRASGALSPAVGSVRQGTRGRHGRCSHASIAGPCRA